MFLACPTRVLRSARGGLTYHGILIYHVGQQARRIGKEWRYDRCSCSSCSEPRPALNIVLLAITLLGRLLDAAGSPPLGLYQQSSLAPAQRTSTHPSLLLLHDHLLGETSLPYLPRYTPAHTLDNTIHVTHNISLSLPCLATRDTTPRLVLSRFLAQAGAPNTLSCVIAGNQYQHQR